MVARAAQELQTLAHQRTPLPRSLVCEVAGDRLPGDGSRVRMSDSERKQAAQERAEAVVGFLTSRRGLITVGVLGAALAISLVWSVFA